MSAGSAGFAGRRVRFFPFSRLVLGILCIQLYPTTSESFVRSEGAAFVGISSTLDHRLVRAGTTRSINLMPLDMAREPAAANPGTASSGVKAVQKSAAKTPTSTKTVKSVRGRPAGKRSAPLKALVDHEQDIYERPQQTEVVKRNMMEQVLTTGSVTEVPSKEDLECLSVLTLKEICADLGLVQRGRKAELVDRIDAARSGGTEKEEKKRQKNLLRDQLEAQLRSEWYDQQR